MFRRKKETRTPVRQSSLTPGQESYAFRRSRTLTGSSSPKINSSAEMRSQLKTARLKVHELRQLRRKLTHSLLIVAVLAVVCVILLALHVGPSNIDYPQTSQQAFSSQPVTAQYRLAIEQYFGEHPFQSFSFAVSQSALTSYLTQKYPEIASVSIDRQNLGLQTGFSIIFRKPLLVWQTSAGQFFVDSNGVAFKTNYFTAPTLQVVDKSGISLSESNGVVASNSFIRFLGQLVAAVNSGGKGQVVSITIPASTREVDLRLSGRNYDIKTQTDRDPNLQAEDLINALNFFDQRKIVPQYVDVRVPGKAYYK